MFTNHQISVEVSNALSAGLDGAIAGVMVYLLSKGMMGTRRHIHLLFPPLHTEDSG